MLDKAENPNVADFGGFGILPYFIPYIYSYRPCVETCLEEGGKQQLATPDAYAMFLEKLLLSLSPAQDPQISPA